MTGAAGRAQLASVALSDRYVSRSGPILISGVQALVRLMLLQAQRDAAAGLKTGGFVSGYRGSPLGTLDTAFESAKSLAADAGIVVRPAVNEELGATAVAGSQQIAQAPAAQVDGVFALWYGKGPGLDRASDALRHGNYQGASAHGGVVLAVGDDHVAKSSSIVCYSDEVVAALQTPLFYPADPREIVEYGLHGFALSRLTGSYAALKIITEVADSTRVVDTGEMAIAPVLPDIAVPPIGLHNRWPDSPLEQERRQVEFRLPAVAAYVRANGLDRVVLKESGARIGLVSAGKAWLDLLEALRLIGLDDGRLGALGVALYKPAMIWPLEPDGLRAFAGGLEHLVVVEEKSEFIERQIKAILYRAEAAPGVWGKRGPDGAALLPAVGELTPERIAAELGGLIADMTGDGALREAVGRARRSLAVQTTFEVPPALRKPFFCSGCPHNRSTVVPEGSRATAGIGCHGLAAYNNLRTGSFAQMGGEGIHWMGLSPFTGEKHVFANMGDGTYFHSGLLAIRQAVSAGLNITYKLLYNSAVAMTGGQSVDGELSVLQVVEQLRAEGVMTVVVSTDDPDRYPPGDPVRHRVERIEHRDDLEALQLELREREGVSVIVYDQMCATEKRRLRKRGNMADAAKRVFINELVCEGCGDCSVKSNCLSVEPVETVFGTKRRINQSSCNKDLSCLTGFCPSFVTVEGGTLRRPKTARTGSGAAASLPAPPLDTPVHARIVVAGVGGTGVVTIGALLAMAAHMSGRHAAVLDQVGMAQKGGAVISHVHLAERSITALRIPTGAADLVLACDQIVANMRDVMSAVAPGRSKVVANADVSITGNFTQDRNAAPDAAQLARRLQARAGDEHFAAFPFTRLAERLSGDAIGSNLMMLGFAWQKGWLALDGPGLDAAIDLNGTAVAMNKAAFGWGRRLALAPEEVMAVAGLTDNGDDPAPEDIVACRAAFLAEYQDDAYARRFSAAVERVAQAEARLGGKGAFTTTVAKGLFRVMAYKDEYEVARLYTDGSFSKAIRETFDNDIRLTFHLAPPLLAKRDRVSGHVRKRAYGAWVLPLFRVLAKARRLRGTAFDPFGRTAERRAERRMIVDYELLIEQLLDGLSADNLADAERVAAMVLEVRGYGHFKQAAMATYAATMPEALAAFQRSVAYRSRVCEAA